MLVDEHGISIGVDDNETGGPGCRLVRPVSQLHSLSLQLALQVADVGKRVNPLKRAYRVIVVLHDQPVPSGIAGENREAEILEAPRSLTAKLTENVPSCILYSSRY